MHIYMNQNPIYDKYQIGDWSFGNPNVLFDWEPGSSLTIGKFCSIAHNVTIMLGGEHNVDWVNTFPLHPLFSEAIPFPASTYQQERRKNPFVHIGNDVWIGYEALILSGVSIGNGAVIAARSTVTKDVPPYSIVGGSPARLIRHRFPPDIIEDLQHIAWWDWPAEHIQAAGPLLLSSQVKKFVDTYKKTLS